MDYEKAKNFSYHDVDNITQDGNINNSIKYLKAKTKNN